jgi:sporulation protein YlmC with PRC-barrel domain
MSEQGAIDLGLGIVDHQLVDADGRRCGKVDDLEIEGVGEGSPRVVAVVVGGSGWRGRGRLGALTARLARRRAVIVPWEEVESVDSGVRLRKRASELGLGRGDDRARPWIERIPGSGL